MKVDGYEIPCTAEEFAEESRFAKWLKPEMREDFWVETIRTWIRIVLDNAESSEQESNEYIESVLSGLLDGAPEVFEKTLIEIAEESEPAIYNKFLESLPRDEKNHLTKLRNQDELRELVDSQEMSEYIEIPETLQARKDGKRITSQAGICYVCDSVIGSGRGELMLKWEIPLELREKNFLAPGSKWRMRCLKPECSDDRYGKRIPVKHPRSHLDRRNEKAESCIICKVPINANEGFLVERNEIPKWLWARRAFPGAREKIFYVVCGRQD